MPKMNRFPKTVYVVTEDDTDGGVYFTAGETAAEFAEIGSKRKVAVYRLDQVLTVEGVVKVA